MDIVSRKSSYVARLFSPPSVEPDLNQMNHSENCTHTDTILNIPITAEEIHSALTQLDESKAPGSDKICPSILKDEKIMQYLQILSQKCFNSSTVPNSWLHSTITQFSRDQEADMITIIIGESLYNHVLQKHSAKF